MMNPKIERESQEVRRNLELEVEQGTFPDVDLDQVIDTLRRGIIDIKEGRGIPAKVFMEEMSNKYLYKNNFSGGVYEKI